MTGPTNAGTHKTFVAAVVVHEAGARQRRPHQRSSATHHRDRCHARRLLQSGFLAGAMEDVMLSLVAIDPPRRSVDRRRAEEPSPIGRTRYCDIPGAGRQCDVPVPVRHGADATFDKCHVPVRLQAARHLSGLFRPNTGLGELSPSSPHERSAPRRSIGRKPPALAACGRKNVYPKTCRSSARGRGTRCLLVDHIAR